MSMTIQSAIVLAALELYQYFGLDVSEQAAQATAILVMELAVIAVNVIGRLRAKQTIQGIA